MSSQCPGWWCEGGAGRAQEFKGGKGRWHFYLFPRPRQAGQDVLCTQDPSSASPLSPLVRFGRQPTRSSPFDPLSWSLGQSVQRIISRPRPLGMRSIASPRCRGRNGDCLLGRDAGRRARSSSENKLTTSSYIFFLAVSFWPGKARRGPSAERAEQSRADPNPKPEPGKMQEPSCPPPPQNSQQQPSSTLHSRTQRRPLLRARPDRLQIEKSSHAETSLTTRGAHI